MSNTVNDPMLTLHLPLSQVNVILQGLGELPLKVARKTTETIEKQATAEIGRQQEFLRAPAQQAKPGEASKEAGAPEGPIPG